MLYENFSKILQQLCPHQNYLLALSGGLDSCVLLHLLNHFKDSQHTNNKIRVIHIHHGLSPNADAWDKFCAQLCKAYSLPFIMKKVSLDLHAKHGLEAEARKKRYQVFAKNLEENEVLLTAHTQSDQAETVLLQLFRGAGKKGLSAMPVKKILGHSEHIRPLLNFSRENLHEYALQHNLLWIEDESNRDERFDRNFLRQAIFPRLKIRWPAVNTHLMQAAHSFSEDAELFENLADLDLVPALTAYPNQLKIDPLLSLSTLRQKNALRRFFQLNKALMPDRKRLQQIIDTIFLSKSDKNPCIRWKAIELHRFQGRIYLIQRLPDFDSSLILHWNFEQALKLPNDLGILAAEKKMGKGIHSNLDFKKISVRFRQGGETIKWHGQTQALKKLFHFWKIPPWERERIPLIFYGEDLISVVGFAIADNYQACEGEPGFFI